MTGSSLALSLYMQDTRPNIESVSADRSIAAIGQCSHIGGINASAISQTLLISHAGAAELVVRGMDPVISLRAHDMLGERHAQSMKWLFRRSIADTGNLTSSLDWESLNLQLLGSNDLRTTGMHSAKELDCVT